MMNVARLCQAALLLLATAPCQGGLARIEPARALGQKGEASRTMTPSENQIVLTRTFSAPPERVFAAMTQADQIGRWMKSTYAELVTCEVDLRVGGTFRYVFSRPNGRRLEVRGTYQAVEPPRRFVYLETYDFSPLKVLVTTTLQAEAEATRFEQTLQYATKAERDADYDGVVSSAREAHDELERYLQRGGQ